MPDSVHIVIADPHSIYRRELRRALESVPDFCVVGEAETALQTLDLSQRLQANLVLIDMHLGDISAVISGLHDTAPQARIVLMTLDEDKEDVVEALRTGVSAQISKDVPLDKLIASLRAVQRGQVLVSPSLTGLVLRKFRQLSQTSD